MVTSRLEALLSSRSSRRSFLIGAGAVGATGLLAACGSGSTGSGSNSGSGEITIGNCAALTGVAAPYGTQALNALQLAAKDLNSIGGVLGKKVVIKAVDNQSKPDAVPAVMKQLVQDGCRLIFGASASPPTIVAATTADQLKVPLLVPMEAASDIIGDGRKYVFKLAPGALDKKGWGAQSVRAVMEGAKAAGKPVKTAMIINNDTGAAPEILESWQRTLKEEYPDVQLLDSIVYDEAATSDFAPLVSKAQAKNPEVLFFGGNPKGSFGFYPALKASGWVPRATVGCLGGNTNTKFIETVGDISENDIAGNYWTPDLPPKSGSKFTPQKFYDDYKAAYGNQVPDGVGALYYATLGVAADALERAGTAEDAEKITQALRKTDFDGLSGDKHGMYIVGHGVKFDSKGFNTKAVGMVTQIQAGKYLPVYPKPVAVTKISYPRPGSN